MMPSKEHFDKGILALLNLRLKQSSPQEKLKSKISSSPNLLRHLQHDGKQQPTTECMTQFCGKLRECLGQFAKEATTTNVDFIKCHVNESIDRSNHWINLMTKFVQLLLVSIQNVTHSSGASDPLHSSEISSQMSKVIESEMRPWMKRCQKKQYDQTVIVSPPSCTDCKFSKSEMRYDNEMISTKSFISQEVNHNSENFCPASLKHPQCPNESRMCHSSSYHSHSKRLKTPISSFESEFYNKRSDGVALSTSSFSVSNSYKMFNHGCAKNSKMSESLIKTKGSEIKLKDLPSTEHSLLPNLRLNEKAKVYHGGDVKAAPISVFMASKYAGEDSLCKRNTGHFHQSGGNSEPKGEESTSVVVTKSSRMSALSKEKDQIVHFSKHPIYDNGGWCEEKVINESCNLSDKYQLPSPAYDKNEQNLKKRENKLKSDIDSNGDNSSIPTITNCMKNSSDTNISSPQTNSSDQMPSPFCRVVSGKGPKSINSKSQMIVESQPHLHCNIMSAKIHNVNNQGELVNVPVGKAFNCFVNDHRLLKGISLYKGKRDIKKLLVYLSRQEDVTRQATSWKRGKEVLERNRLDDYFQLTQEGMEEQKQVHHGKKRDQYVVNWYMWCPGHGNCKRKCGGYGKCIENCKGMLHKQDRHNCSLMVNLKLFLSDLSTWRVHITGSHTPEQSATTTAMPLSSHGGPQCHPNPGRNDGADSSSVYEFDESDQCLDKTQSSCTDMLFSSKEALEGNPFLPNISKSEIGNSATLLYEKEHDLLQSKIPSKKRISKMLSSLKRRRQNKPYGLLKSRLTNSNSSGENGNGPTPSLPKKSGSSLDFKDHTMTARINAKYSGVTSDLSQALADSFNQSSLLSELSSYLPNSCRSDNGQGEEPMLVAETDSNSRNLKSVSDMTKSPSDVVTVPFTCNNNSTSQYTNCVTVEECARPHYDMAGNIDTSEMPQEDVDIYHPSMSLPNFHQPFLNANSLTEILTEAGVNISEHFDDLNSSIILGNDSSCLSEINQTTEAVNESYLPFQSSQQQSELLPSTSLLGKEFSNVIVPDGHLNPRINPTCENSMETLDGLPTYKEATRALSKQKSLSDRMESYEFL